MRLGLIFEVLVRECTIFHIGFSSDPLISFLVAGEKQDTTATFLADAAKAGAIILSGDYLDLASIACGGRLCVASCRATATPLCCIHCFVLTGNNRNQSTDHEASCSQRPLICIQKGKKICLCRVLCPESNDKTWWPGETAGWGCCLQSSRQLRFGHRDSLRRHSGFSRISAQSCTASEEPDHLSGKCWETPAPALWRWSGWRFPQESERQIRWSHTAVILDHLSSRLS